MKSKNDITELVLSGLSYKDGELFYKGTRLRVGRERQYFSCTVPRCGRFYVHHLVWCIHHGRIPHKMVVSIIDMNQYPRIENLRLLNYFELNCAKGMRSDNQTGYRGVCKLRDRFQTSIGLAGKKVYLGTFDTPEQGGAAFEEAASVLHPPFRGPSALTAR
jgi:hypothetical protein